MKGQNLPRFIYLEAEATRFWTNSFEHKLLKMRVLFNRKLQVRRGVPTGELKDKSAIMISPFPSIQQSQQLVLSDWC